MGNNASNFSSDERGISGFVADSPAVSFMGAATVRAGHEGLYETAEIESAVNNAVCRMADRVGLRGKDLAAILGVSASYVSMMRRGAAAPAIDSHPYENAVLLIRTLDSLWSLTVNDTAVKRYLYSAHETLGEIPAEMMKRPEGLVDMTRYVESQFC